MQFLELPADQAAAAELIPHPAGLELPDRVMPVDLVGLVYGCPAAAAEQVPSVPRAESTAVPGLAG